MKLKTAAPLISLWPLSSGQQPCFGLMTSWTGRSKSNSRLEFACTGELDTAATFWLDSVQNQLDFTSSSCLLTCSRPLGDCSVVEWPFNELTNSFSIISLDSVDEGIPQQEGYVLYHIIGCYDSNNICFIIRSDKSDNDSNLK